ncbi:uncharacterized protein PV07_04057 [Cladophialophora immunda]|uniref:Uncharacterized protein n=1 Tax=Cladophialophora immunda TaxID=569365 RepID=A0A0D1ZWK9_9EURO|nr:uncharacterized protein PV07_04057 [Cladophialophora immunda]KIW32521.1 hypothetical protein PV07_04057 [Cladophialophora immunda]
MNLPPQAVNDLSKLLRTKSNKKSDEAWKDMVEVYKHEQESDRCARTANDIDAAIAASSAVLPPRFFHTPACSLLRQESLENRIKSKQKFQEALTEHYKASYERGQAATYNEDAQLLDDELKKRKKCCQSQCCNCRACWKNGVKIVGLSAWLPSSVLDVIPEPPLWHWHPHF